MAEATISVEVNGSLIDSLPEAEQGELAEALIALLDDHDIISGTAVLTVNKEA